MQLEMLKNEKDKFVTKVDKKKINRLIDRVCDKVFGGFLEEVNP